MPEPVAFTKNMRDMESNPYSKDEQRVVKYLLSIMPQIGTGDDPIGFLMACHQELMVRLALEGQEDNP